jgi:hypothetical protein
MWDGSESSKAGSESQGRLGGRLGEPKDGSKDGSESRPYLWRSSRTRSTGIASAVPKRLVTVVARSSEL